MFCDKNKLLFRELFVQINMIYFMAYEMYWRKFSVQIGELLFLSKKVEMRKMGHFFTGIIKLVFFSLSNVIFSKISEALDLSF
jgi:hypothetical protein